MNPRISARERGLLKGAIRRVFSRSDLRREVLKAYSLEHYDNARPRVKNWSFCAICGMIVPTYTCAVDHIEPVVPIDSALDRMTWDEVIDRQWCIRRNLQVLCETCHSIKTAEENKVRRANKKKGK